MDTRSLCLFLLVGSLIQVNDATPSFKVIAQYIPKFVSLAIEVAKTVGNGTQEILHTQDYIKKLVNSAEETLAKQLADIDKFIADAKDKAAKSDADITSCIAEEKQAMDQTHLNILEKCRLQDGVKHLYMFSLRLAKEEVSLSLTAQWCILRHPLDGDALKTCFDDKIDDVQGKINGFQKEIFTTLPEAMEYSNSCTAKYLESLNMALKKIYLNFKDCIEEVIS